MTIFAREVAHLNQIFDEIQSATKELLETSEDLLAQERQECERKLQLFGQLVIGFRARYPGTPEADFFEAGYFCWRAVVVEASHGLARRCIGEIVGGQDRIDVDRAVSLYDKSLEIADAPWPHIGKAGLLWYALRDKPAALAELKHLATHFPDWQVSKVSALVREIESSQPRG